MDFQDTTEFHVSLTPKSTTPEDVSLLFSNLTAIAVNSNIHAELGADPSTGEAIYEKIGTVSLSALNPTITGQAYVELMPQNINLGCTSYRKVSRISDFDKRSWLECL